MTPDQSHSPAPGLHHPLAHFPAPILAPTLQTLSQLTDLDFAPGQARAQSALSSHPRTKTLLLRGPSDLTSPGAWFSSGPDDIQDTEALLSGPCLSSLLGLCLAEIRQAIPELAEAKLGYALIARLPAGAIVHPHTDCGSYASKTRRFHLALGPAKASFLSWIAQDKAELWHLTPGDLAEFPHRRPHCGANLGQLYRDELIFDLFR